MQSPAKSLATALFPIAEILTILVIGNVLGGLTIQALGPVLGIDLTILDDPAQLAGNWGEGAKTAAFALICRFFWILLTAYLVMRFVHGFTLKRVGVSRGGYSLRTLLLAGVLTFAVADIPFKLAFLADAAFGIGEGLEGWRMWSGLEVTLPYIMFVLAAQCVLPPLFEEPFARGYMRVRFEQNYRALGGVLMAGYMFMGAHGHFYVMDELVLSAFAAKIFAAFLWGWVVYRMNSVIPAMVAHALGNIPFPIDWGYQLSVLAVMAVIIAIGRTRLRQEACAFIGLARKAPWAKIIFGLVVVGLMWLGVVNTGNLVLFGVPAAIITIVSWLPPVRRWAEETAEYNQKTDL